MKLAILIGPLPLIWPILYDPLVAVLTGFHSLYTSVQALWIYIYAAGQAQLIEGVTAEQKGVGSIPGGKPILGVLK